MKDFIITLVLWTGYQLYLGIKNLWYSRVKIFKFAFMVSTIFGIWTYRFVIIKRYNSIAEKIEAEKNEARKTGYKIAEGIKAKESE